MAFDILFWLGWGAFAGILVLFVYVVIAIIYPAKTSVAWQFIKAKRKNMPIVALDNGSRWIFKVAKAVKSGVIVDDEDLQIEITPKSLKWGGGVLFGAGEYFRSKLANAKLVDLLARAEKEGWSNEKIIKKVASMQELVNEEIKRRENGYPQGAELEQLASNVREQAQAVNIEAVELKNNGGDQDVRVRQEQPEPVKSWNGRQWKN